eukprot:g15687.t1
MGTTTLENEESACAGDASGSAPVEELALKSYPEAMLENATRELESIHKKLLAESLIVFHDKRTSSRQLATQILTRMVGRLAVVQGADDIQAVVDKLHVPHPTRGGVDAVITDLDPKVPKLMEFLRMRSLQPGLGKLPIVAVIVVVDTDDPRPELLASAIESGVDAVMRRPLERATLTSCVGEVLRRHASVEFVYKDVVGEVETFNYPRFLLEGFQFLGAAGESSLGGGVGDSDGFNDIVGEAVRTYTLQSGGSGNASMTTVGSGGWAPEVVPNGGNATGTLRSSSIAAATAGAPLTAPPGATAAPTPATVVAEPTPTTATAAGGTTERTEDGGQGGSVGAGSGYSKLALRMMGKAKAVTIIQGGHIKISSPSLRPRLYLYPGDKGYIGGGSATGAGPSSEGGGGCNGAGRGTGGDGVDDRRAESERQVSHELAPFVKRRAPALGDPATSAGLHKGTLARTMKLAWGAKGRTAASAVSGFPFAVAAATVADDQNCDLGGEHAKGVPSAATAALGGTARAGGSWKAAPKRTPLPESGNPVSQKKVFSASGTQGRRAATRAGMFDEVTRSHQTNTNPTEMASTADLRSALGVGVTGEDAARRVIGRMMKKRKQAKRRAARLASDSGKGRGCPAGEEMSCGRGDASRFAGRGRGVVAPGAEGLGSRGKKAGGRTGGNIEGKGGDGRAGGSRGNKTAAVKGTRAKKAVKGIAGSGTGADFLEEGMFKTVLSSLAKKRLRAGLLEIKTNPTDVLRCGFVEVEPTRYGSTALGCHLIKGWTEQKAGNKRRALGHYRKAVASEPENVEALFCKAVVSAQLMELFDALKDFSAAISFKLHETTTATLQRGASQKRAGRAMGGGHTAATASSRKGTGGVSRGVTTPVAGGGAGGTQAHERAPSGKSGESNVNLAHLYGNRALVHVCLGDDASALNDLDRAVARDTRNVTIGRHREQDTAAGNRGGSSNSGGCQAMLKGGEVAATPAHTLSGQLTDPLPAVTTETAPPINPAVNTSSTTANDTKKASANTTTHDPTNNDTKAGNNRNSSFTNPVAGAKIDARPSEEWSDQFRDRRLMEDTYRRRALTRQLFSPDAESETEYPEDKNCTGTGARAGGKHSSGSFREKSGQGASLGEFKTSMGLSAKGALFDHLFCRPSHVDEALTTEPGRRTPEQINHVVEALAACPTFTGLDKDTLAEIGNVAEYRVLEKMAPAFLQGEETDAMAVVLSGRVAVKMRRADLSVVTADELGPGESFGEACMLEEHRTLALRHGGSLNDADADADDNGNGSNTQSKDETIPEGWAKEDMNGEGDRANDSCEHLHQTTTTDREKEKQERRSEAPDNLDACPAGSGEAGLADGVDASGGGGPILNPNLGRSMETYQTLEPTRLVLILKADFHRIPGLLKHCSHAFKRRLEAITLSGLFGGWDHEDLMRLARMSRIHRHASKAVLLMQRKEPSHLHIVLSGTCTVTKYPDRLAAVRRKINEIGAALYRIRSKYAYHRDVRTTVAKGSSSAHTIPKIGNPLAGRPASAPAVGGGQARLPRTLVAECSAPLSHVTSTEVRKAELEREMRKWKRNLALIRRKDGDVVDTSQVQG